MPTSCLKMKIDPASIDVGKMESIIDEWLELKRPSHWPQYPPGFG